MFGKRFKISLVELHSASPIPVRLRFGRVSKASFVHPAVWSSSQVVARLGSWREVEFQSCIKGQSAPRAVMMLILAYLLALGTVLGGMALFK